jgi:hypothetical protein
MLKKMYAGAVIAIMVSATAFVVFKVIIAP